MYELNESKVESDVSDDDDESRLYPAFAVLFLFTCKRLYIEDIEKECENVRLNQSF